MTVIVERPLYTRIALEVFSLTAGTWVDVTSKMTSLDYSEGGRLGMPGANTVDVGSLNAQFNDLSAVPAVGDFIRLKRAGTTEYAFTGYVRDISQRIVFSNRVKLSTPITLTTLYCSDWVGFASQWIVNGVGGRNGSYNLLTTGNYAETERIRALNYAFDNSNSTQLITPTSESGSSSIKLNDTDFSGTMADHLDLISRSTGMVWYGSHTIPTDNTTGRDNLIKWQASSGSLSSGKTFTDQSGSAGQLHYTEIDFESSSANVANVINIRNKSLIRFPDVDLSRIGGANENNFIYVDLSTKQIGIFPETEWRYDDATSQANYGARFADIDTNIATDIASTTISSVKYYFVNQIANPSAEYTDNGYSASSVNRVRRRQPNQESVPFEAADGSWSIRVRQRSTNNQSSVLYSGGETDGIPVTPGRYYSFSATAARGNTSRTDLRALIQINWYDADESLISSSSGSNVSLTTASTWYDISHFALAPSNTNRATLQIIFSRPGSLLIQVADIAWVDKLMMYRVTSANTPSIAYMDGDTAKGTAGITVWTGEVGDSQSVTLNNQLYNRGAEIAAQYANTNVRATRIRWNAQEDLTAISSITVGKTISLIYKSITTTYRIIGIDATVETDRYMINYYLVKV